MLTEHKFDTVHWQDAGDGLGRRAVYIVTVCPQLPLRLLHLASPTRQRVQPTTR